LNNLKLLENYQKDYIIIKKYQNKRSQRNAKSLNDEQVQCCPDQGTGNCLCDILVYKIRPYTYEFLNAIQQYFEIVVFSKMHHKIIENIIDHIESVLNKPIRQFLENYKKKPKKSSFQRVKKLPDIKLFFQFIIHQRQYIHIKDYDRYVENLLLLTKNRKKEDLIYISSNPFRIITALNDGYLTIPLIQYECQGRSEYQLCLLENYIMKHRHLKDMRARIREDFKFLMNKAQKQSSSGIGNQAQLNASSNDSIQQRNNLMNDPAENLQFDVNSRGSFG